MSRFDSLTYMDELNKSKKAYSSLNLAHGHITVLELFIIFIDRLNFFKITSLMCPLSSLSSIRSIFKSGYEEIVKLLIKNGANVNLKGWLDRSPLVEAAEYGNYFILLLKSVIINSS